MKLNTTMPAYLSPHFQKELIAFKKALETDQLRAAWQHLERAHILGQAYPIAHTRVHWKMLLFGLRIKSLKEVLGQLPRLLLGGVKSFVGVIPTGNTGGANVPPLKSMLIPEDLNKMLHDS